MRGKDARVSVCFCVTQLSAQTRFTPDASRVQVGPCCDAEANVTHSVTLDGSRRITSLGRDDAASCSRDVTT